jgi:hypothetical protein
VEIRKAQRYQIINRFKEFEIRLNRLYEQENASFAQGFGNHAASQA